AALKIPGTRLQIPGIFASSNNSKHQIPGRGIRHLAPKFQAPKFMYIKFKQQAKAQALNLSGQGRKY
ncbi:MAG TPA: hypothetical protein VK941_13905, partial [Gillisia sp.]|nr:hypothetical protein [Gillisia sp.]